MPNEDGNKLIKKIKLLLEKPKRLLATILISNNFINIAIVILFASIDNPYLSSLNSPILETVLEVGLIGMLILFIGDILPKIYANRNPLGFSKLMVRPIYFLDHYILFLFKVPYKGPVSAIIHQLMGGVRSAMGYAGCSTMGAMRTEPQFVRVTSAGMSESHVHDVSITKEAPNYPVR